LETCRVCSPRSQTKLLALLVAVSTVVMWSSPSTADDGPTDSGALAAEIASMTRVTEQLHVLADFLGGPKPTPEAAVRTERAMTATLAATYDLDELQALRSFYQTDVGRRILGKTARYVLSFERAWDETRAEPSR
jgi:hypothetical protein